MWLVIMTANIPAIAVIMPSPSKIMTRYLRLLGCCILIMSGIGNIAKKKSAMTCRAPSAVFTSVWLKHFFTWPADQYGEAGLLYHCLVNVVELAQFSSDILATEGIEKHAEQKKKDIESP